MVNNITILVSYNKLYHYILAKYEEDRRIDFINIRVAAGEISKVFAIFIYNDNIAECDEMLILNISALTCGVVIGRNDTSNITTRDDDGRRWG